MTTPGAEVACFLDSNVVLYALGDEEPKRSIAIALLARQPTISTQVINECSHVLRRKQALAPDEVARLMEDIVQLTRVADVGLTQIRSAWDIAARFRYGHYDSLIIASAFAAGCSILYTEDMQNGQIIDERMTLVDPFGEQARP